MEFFELTDKVNAEITIPAKALLTQRNLNGKKFWLAHTNAAAGGAKSHKIGCMCRSIKTLFNFDPPVTTEEVQAASLQFVRKITGFNKPSKANEAAFEAAIDEIATISNRLLRSLETTAPPKNREEEAAKAKARAAERFGT
jgi:hypothetical protein